MIAAPTHAISESVRPDYSPRSAHPPPVRHRSPPRHVPVAVHHATQRDHTVGGLHGDRFTCTFGSAWIFCAISPMICASFGFFEHPTASASTSRTHEHHDQRILALIAFLLGSDTWLDAELLLLDYPHLTCQH